jgi:DNA topoisomerase-1
VERKTKQKKRIFYGCANYPTCNFAIWERPIPDLCPSCAGLMVVPKPGQDPVCYNEVIAVQRSMEAKPTQDGEKTTKRTIRRKATQVAAADAESVAVPAQRRTTGASPTTRRRVTKVDGQAVTLDGSEAVTTAQKTPTRTKAKGTTAKTSTTRTAVRKTSARPPTAKTPTARKSATAGKTSTKNSRTKAVK